MAQQAVAQDTITSLLACSAFIVSETCYRYEAKISDDNTVIAEQLFKTKMLFHVYTF